MSAARWGLLLLCAGLLAGGEAEPGDGPGAGFQAAPVLTSDGLTATLHTPLAIPRADAPYPVVVSARASGPSLRRGAFVIEVMDGVRTLCRWQGDEVVIGAGGRTSTVLLPPLDLRDAADVFELRLSFLSDGARRALGSRSIVLRDGRERVLALAMCLPALNQGPGQGLAGRLALERLAPRRAAPEEAAPGEDMAAYLLPTGLRTIPAQLQPADLPESALAWCAYDTAVIAGEHLAGITTRQAQALEQWLRAGGAACLLGEGRVAPAIGALVARAAQEQGMEPDPRWLTPDERPTPHARLRLGLGRLVVTPWKPADGAYDDSQWRRSAAFLWRLRAEQARFLAGNATWDAELMARTEIDRANKLPGQAYQAFLPRLDLRSDLVALLWPERVEVIPFSVILLIFLVFVVMVGPGDWLLLGVLRARRWTWVLFPVVAIACTWFTVWISRQYLGANDQFRHLRIVDVAPDGSQLRNHRFELVFTGSSKVIAGEVTDALWTPLGSGGDLSAGAQQFIRGSSLGVARDAEAARYRGSLPGRYAVEQDVAQWTPELRRELSFTPVALPWALPTAPVLAAEDLEQISAPWRASVGSGGVAMVLRGRRVVATHGDATILDSTAAMNRWNHSGGVHEHWLTALSCHPTRGCFALLSSMAPTGGANISDLALLDPSDAGQLLVVYAVRQGDTLWVVRCLHHQPGPARPSPPATPL